MIETQFVTLAMSIGVPGKIATLIDGVDAATAELADRADCRWIWRLEDQRRLLQQPTLRTVVALTTRLVEERPELASVAAAALTPLATRHPEFAPYLARVLNPDGARLGVPLQRAG